MFEEWKIRHVRLSGKRIDALIWQILTIYYDFFLILMYVSSIFLEVRVKAVIEIDRNPSWSLYYSGERQTVNKIKQRNIQGADKNCGEK